MVRKPVWLSLFIMAAILLSACQPLVAPADSQPAQPATAAKDLPENGAIAEVNDVALYYEIHGVGEPLIFMPGDMRTTEDVAELTELLAQEYQVIVMDARGRGRSTDAATPLTMANMADDAVALLDELGIDQAHVVSWASSAAVGLDMAMRHPDRVDKLVTHGPNYTVDGLAPDHRAWFESLTVADMVPMFEEQYNRTAPDPAYLPTMLARLQELILSEPNFTVAMLSQIQASTLVIDGDLDDWIVREHLETMAAAIPNGELVLLPELTHFAPFEDPAAWSDAVMAFLAPSDGETGQMPADLPVPRFEPADCTYAYPEGEEVECGYLIVPEDRSVVDGPLTRVYIQKFKSANPNPAADPVVYMPGGPGSSGPFYAFLATSLPPGQVLRTDRDMLLMEYRGATLSEPAFFCPELEGDLDDFAGMSYSEEVAWNAEALQRCYQRLTDQGHNLSAYHVAAAAADVADLRTALGFDEINVVGVSYGTPVLMELLRDHSEGVRSVILDSVNPPEVNYYGEQLSSFNMALTAVFDVCAADPTCAAAYPTLASDFYDTLAALRVAPVVVTVEQEGQPSIEVAVDDLMLVNFAYENIFLAGSFTGLPAALDAVASGDYQAVAEDWLSRIGGRTARLALVRAFGAGADPQR
ncbi:MAG: alpha/beta hydrolase [Caldilineaceae bacterium]|nr:alpha/beta hydrolase [Caldilineaceae bacterium]